jgi:DNA-binding beta-propeller fold protein YncE
MSCSFFAQACESAVCGVVDHQTNPASPTYNTVVATIPVGGDPSGVAVSPDGTHIYVTNETDNTVSMFPLTVGFDPRPAPTFADCRMPAATP